MKSIRRQLTLALLAFSLAACIPAGTSAPAPADLPPAATQLPSGNVDDPAGMPVAGTAGMQAIPTSRGPDLAASDPAAVRLASGGLQLVEFFRFT
jgi:hypothetical protein